MDEVYSGLLCTLYTTSGKVHWHPWANKKKKISDRSSTPPLVPTRSSYRNSALGLNFPESRLA